jgi:hypothetical protein
VLRHKKIFFFSGLSAIILVYAAYNIFLLEAGDYFLIPRIVRHFSGLGCVLLVYGIGSYALKMYTVGWMMLIWHLLHAILIFMVLLISLYTLDWGPLTAQWHNFANTLVEFLISPTLYVVIGILNRRLAA